jgi:hypothetical protein
MHARWFSLEEVAEIAHAEVNPGARWMDLSPAQQAGWRALARQYAQSRGMIVLPVSDLVSASSSPSEENEHS